MRISISDARRAASQRGLVRLSLLVVSLLAVNFFYLPGLAGAATNSPTSSQPSQAAAQIFSQPASVVSNGQYSTLVNAAYTENGLRLAGQGFQPPRWSGNWADFGLFSALPTAFAEPFNRLQANWQAEVTDGTHLEVDLRASPDNQNWTLWQVLDTTGQTADFGTDKAFLYAQYRVRLFSTTVGQSPTFHSIELEANHRDLNNLATANYFSLSNIAQSAPAQAGPPTYSVYATREGLVGARTANGHIIQSHDHFVSLPGWTALNDLGKSDYQVKISVPGGKTAIAPVWDTGPWNFHDDYWHSPRHEFRDLPVGVPESEKAYFDNYNGGLNENGDGVYNPSGIDIGDGTYWDDLDLNGASTSGKLDVTFLWEGSVPGAPTISGVQAYGAWQNGIQIKWSTSTAASSWVEYGLTTNYGQTTPVYDPVGNNHNRVLTDLIPGQTYNFRVHNKDIYGQEAISPNLTFQTNPGNHVKLTTFQNDKGIGLTASADNLNLLLLGARINNSFWSDNPNADYLAGGKVEAGKLTGTGDLDLDFATVCDPKGNNCTMGYGTGYKNFVRFANDQGETLEIGLIHDVSLSPGSVTLMVEGNYKDGSKLRYYNAPDSTDQKVGHHFHFALQNNTVQVMFDNARVADPYSFNTSGLSVSFIGAGRAKNDIVAANFQNIAFSYDALVSPAQ